MNRIANKLIDLWEYDVDIMSQPWMYFCLMIPAAMYFAFAVLKWTFITMPIWMPISIIIRSIQEGSSKKGRKKNA